MDIGTSKTVLNNTIKRLALQTTASAILSLNAETLIADPCPAYITSNLSGLICDFGSGSSVTVDNGGTIGGINMVGYSPASPGYIAINTGGAVSNSSGIGITIQSSSLSNGLSNSGTISNTGGSGIVISNTSTIGGGISNSGLISTGSVGIAINSSIINNNIFNSGTINSTNGSAIKISSTSTINGSISNSGTIRTDNVFVGIVIDNSSTITGEIINSGLIEATGNGDGILIRSGSVINGGVTNSGLINSVGNSAIAILNTSNVQGNISNSGTISASNQALSIHNASTVGGSIFNSGSINSANQGISIFSATTISGSISNSGTIFGEQRGISIASTATISGGISNSGTIQGDIFAINIANNSTVSTIDILGQNARIIGAVEAANTQVNITSDAIFTSEGTYNVDHFNINSNARFNMAGTVTANIFNNAGTLAVTNLQTIAGEYTQQIGGLFQTGISSVSDYGQLAVTGAVDLSQNGTIYASVSPNVSLRSGDVFSNVISGNTLTLPSDGFQVSNNSYIWTFTPQLNNANNGLNLIAAINSDAYQVCQGTYCQGAATVILDQIAGGNSLFGSYATLTSDTAFREAASQATPELTNGNIQVTQLIARAVRDSVPMWGTLHGGSSGDAMLYQPGKVWIKPYGASMSQNERNTVDGFHATAYGVVLGKDTQLANNWLFGGAFAAGENSMYGKSVLSGQSINSNAYQGMIYATKKLPNHVYFGGYGSIGYEDNNTQRAIPLYASTARGSYSSWFTNLQAEAGWNSYAFGPNFVFTPMVDASYLYVNQGGYQEHGSLMDLLVASNHNSSLILGGYGNGAYHLATLQDQRDLSLSGYAGVAGDVINNQPQTRSSFVAGGASFTTYGVQFNGLVFRGGAGLTLTNLTKPLSIELNYDLQAGNNAYSGVGSATIKYRSV
jgi:outer membrane autotransporter protein